MPTYTVHAPPPPRASATESDPERFLFVRDGFYFWAFLLAPLWLLLHRLWLVLLGYVMLVALISAGFYGMGAPVLLKFFGSLLVALLMGFEAATLWRWTLARRRWRMLGFVVGDDAEAAERRFFAQWTKQAGAAALPAVAEPHYATPVRRGPPSGSDVIGLFPEPGQ
jgi:Protein of unknown function (DUF2628)